MVTAVFHFTDFDDYPGGDLPQSTMSAWVHDVKAFGVDKIIMIDKTSFGIGRYYKHSDEIIIFERYETLEDCMDIYPDSNWIFLEYEEHASDLTTFIHPENPIYVVGPDFLQIITERQPDFYVKIPMLHFRPLYAHVAMMITLYDRMIKL
jgi:hypothetical protein